MKLNERVFEKLSGEPVEVQEFDGRRVEIFYLDDYPDVLNEFINKAKEAMKRFKEEVASELGVPLKDGYNGDLTSKQAGSIGGEMVKKMIMKQEEQMK